MEYEKCSKSLALRDVRCDVSTMYKYGKKYYS